MDEYFNDYDPLKFSALSKLKQVNPYVTNTTIGPNKCIIDKETVDTFDTDDVNSTKGCTIDVQGPVNSAAIVFNKFLSEIENKRQSKVQEAMNLRINSILEYSKQKSFNFNKELLKRQQIIRTQKQQQELLILSAIEQHDKDILVQHQQLVQYYEELAERKKEKEKELKVQEKRRQQIVIIADRIKKDEIEFQSIQKELMENFKNSKSETALKETFRNIAYQMKTISEKMEELGSRYKIGKVVENDCHISSQLVQEVKGLLKTVREKFSSARETVQQSKVKIITPPSLPKSSTQKLVIHNVAQEETPKKLVGSAAQIDKFISKSSLKLYLEVQNFLEHYIKTYGDLVHNDVFKQFRFDCKKAVNIPVNAISAINSHHMLDKYNRLTSLLSGKVVEVGEIQVCAAKHHQGVSFCTNLLANKFVLQADLMISSNPEAAFCYAAIIKALWNDNPTFGKLLMGHLYKQCPYLVPFYPPRTVGQNDEEYYCNRGYQYTNGIVEKQDKFLKRMTGIMRLYAAIIISKPKRGQEKNPHGLAEGWRWLSSFLNLEPTPDITATMLHVFFETAGSTLQLTYGRVFKKFMNFVCHVYLPLIQKIDSGGPVSRLSVLLQEYLKQGCFEQPQGLLSSNFW